MLEVTCKEATVICFLSHFTDAKCLTLLNFHSWTANRGKEVDSDNPVISTYLRVCGNFMMINPGCFMITPMSRRSGFQCGASSEPVGVGGLLGAAGACSVGCTDRV